MWLVRIIRPRVGKGLDFCIRGAQFGDELSKTFFVKPTQPFVDVISNVVQCPELSLCLDPNALDAGDELGDALIGVAVGANSFDEGTSKSETAQLLPKMKQNTQVVVDSLDAYLSSLDKGDCGRGRLHPRGSPGKAQIILRPSLHTLKTRNGSHFWVTKSSEMIKKIPSHCYSLVRSKAYRGQAGTLQLPRGGGRGHCMSSFAALPSKLQTDYSIYLMTPGKATKIGLCWILNA